MPLSKTLISAIEKNLISHINFSCSRLTLSDIYLFTEALKHNYGIKYLDLSYNHLCILQMYLDNATIGTNLAVGISASSIKCLNISGCGIKFDDIERFIAPMVKTSKSLTSLDLSKNCISNKGATELFGALKFNTTIESLYLSDNSITDPVVNSLVELMKTNSTITYFDFSHNLLSTGVFSLLIPNIYPDKDVATTFNFYENKKIKPFQYSYFSTINRSLKFLINLEDTENYKKQQSKKIIKVNFCGAEFGYEEFSFFSDTNPYKPYLRNSRSELYHPFDLSYLDHQIEETTMLGAFEPSIEVLE